MEKTLISEDYRVLLDLLKEVRKRSGITQVELATRLGMTQSAVSKSERGERRLDVVELRAWCQQGLNIALCEFIVEFEARLATSKVKRRKPGRS